MEKCPECNEQYNEEDAVWENVSPSINREHFIKFCPYCKEPIDAQDEIIYF